MSTWVKSYSAQNKFRLALDKASYRMPCRLSTPSKAGFFKKPCYPTPRRGREGDDVVARLCGGVQLPCGAYCIYMSKWKKSVKARLKVGSIEYRCFGCGELFRRRRGLIVHQGEYWPGCQTSTLF